ncbi:DUF2851 family protein [Luteolibacter sp. LG18]|uniref:DUF2851 family protein n=1 Tax=Luteolibacter sp. LG18 TaxID=2819286 RepID=UPI002B2F47E7|nr:hypothetical protein llg_03670 [Luteolibacter sp. LG18]
MSYTRLIEHAFAPAILAEPLARPLPPELELQALWFAGAFGRNFTTTAGNTVRIVQFGEWNRSAGPDFIHAAVEINGTLKTGAIELDPEAEDWERHGHSGNPSYRDVALHVVFRGSPQDQFTRDCDHREVPRIEVPHLLLEDALNLPRREIAIARPGRCVRPLAGMDSVAVSRLLEEASTHRAARKAARFLRTADAHGRDAALFQATAETLGYRGNSLAMRLLAQRAPLSAMKEETDHEALLFGTAGFLSPVLHEKAPSDTRDYLRGLWDSWWKQRGRFETGDARVIPWKLHGHRPANHPHRRAGALSALVSVWPKYRRVALARPFHPEPVLAFLEELNHAFWERRHTLTSAPTSRPVALFGRSQGLELLANHLVPVALLEDERFDFNSYWKLRASAPNEHVKRCGLRLFGSLEHAKPWFQKVAHHQALIQIYHDFCLEDVSECERCPFPEQLSQWRA